MYLNIIFDIESCLSILHLYAYLVSLFVFFFKTNPVSGWANHFLIFFVRAKLYKMRSGPVMSYHYLGWIGKMRHEHAHVRLQPQKVRVEQTMLQNGLVEKLVFRCISGDVFTSFILFQKKCKHVFGDWEKMPCFSWGSGIGTSSTYFQANHSIGQKL